MHRTGIFEWAAASRSGQLYLCLWFGTGLQSWCGVQAALFSPVRRAVDFAAYIARALRRAKSFRSPRVGGVGRLNKEATAHEAIYAIAPTKRIARCASIVALAARAGRSIVHVGH